MQWTLPPANPPFCSLRFTCGDHNTPSLHPPPWEISGYGPGPSVFNVKNLDWLVRGNKCCSIDFIK